MNENEARAAGAPDIIESAFHQLDDGEMVPILKYYDEEGDETLEHGRAIVYVAGPDANGRYHVRSMSSVTKEYSRVS